jgi:hypothetical protein
MQLLQNFESGHPRCLPPITSKHPLELAGARLAPYLAAPCLLHSTSARRSLTNPHPLILINTQGGLRYKINGKKAYE